MEAKTETKKSLKNGSHRKIGLARKAEIRLQRAINGNLFTHMNDKENKPKRGRRPTGRKTHMVNIRMEQSLRERLRAVAVNTNRTQSAIVEDGVRMALMLE